MHAARRGDRQVQLHVRNVTSNYQFLDEHVKLARRLLGLASSLDGHHGLVDCVLEVFLDSQQILFQHLVLLLQLLEVLVVSLDQHLFPLEAHSLLASFGPCIESVQIHNQLAHLYPWVSVGAS